MKPNAIRSTARPFKVAYGMIIVAAVACFAGMVWHEMRSTPAAIIVDERLGLTVPVWTSRPPKGAPLLDTEGFGLVDACLDGYQTVPA